MSPSFYLNSLPSFLVNNHLTMDNKSLKRSRSTESIEKALKRVKPFQHESPINSDSPINNNEIIYPTLKPISISTRTTTNEYYQSINQFLSSTHKQRFGDPELNESWWKQETEDIEMEEVNESINEYENVNSILRQAFLQRHLNEPNA